ncbi:hypothetical protein ACP70R_027948 [Stipagrostis hirtigluma subsp. patula]
MRTPRSHSEAEPIESSKNHFWSPARSPSPMAAEEVCAAPALPPRVSASSSAPTVGALLTRASAAATGGGVGAARDCHSPRSLLSRILHRGRGGGFGCRLRLPRYCSSGAAAREDAASVKEAAAAAPKVVAGRAEPRESPRNSLAGKKAAVADDALPASLGLGASLVLLLSKSAAELSRMAELRAQMEGLMLDVRADVRSCDGRPSASGDHTDSASVVKEPIVCAGDGENASFKSRGSRTGTAASASRVGSENAGDRAMDQMEAELEAELTRLQLATNDEEERLSSRRDQQLETEAKSGGTSSDHSVICSDNDGGVTDQDSDECHDNDDDNEEDEEEVEDEGNNGETSPAHGGVSARELERRLHELLQSRHEARIAELESALERARRKLRDAERVACRWRDTAKLATRFTDESRLR